MLIDRVLTHSASVPLSIGIGHRSPGLFHFTDSQSSGIIEHIKGVRNRILSLTLSGPDYNDPLALELIGTLKDFPNLQDLHIEDYQARGDVDTVGAECRPNSSCIQALRVRESDQYYGFKPTRHAADTLVNWLSVRKDAGFPLRELWVHRALAEEMDLADVQRDDGNDGWRLLLAGAV